MDRWIVAYLLTVNSSLRPLDTGRKERRIALVMGNRRRLALRDKLIERRPLSREERQHLLGQGVGA
jgi:hypothetical protein